MIIIINDYQIDKDYHGRQGDAGSTECRAEECTACYGCHGRESSALVYHDHHDDHGSHGNHLDDDDDDDNGGDDDDVDSDDGLAQSILGKEVLSLPPVFTSHFHPP